MSRSEELPATDVESHLAEIGRIIAGAGTHEGMPDTADIAAIMSAAVRLYAAGAELAPRELTGAELAVTPTEAVTVAAALLRSQQLTPFEFSIWFSQSRSARGMEEFEDVSDAPTPDR